MNAAESAELILANYRRLFGRDLVDTADPSCATQHLWEAPRAVLSALGPPGSDHLFNYANRTALDLFEYEWRTRTPRRAASSAR
jgi:hypothetical protein